MTFTTANLCDSYSSNDSFQVADPVLQSYGGKLIFSGLITTLKVFEDNTLVRVVLEEKVADRVLVIDGGGSHRCSLIDKNLATLAMNNGWQGIVVNGCIRDSVIINSLPIGIRALNTHPLKSHKKDRGDRDLTISFAGIQFKNDFFLYADADGIVVSSSSLS